MLSRSCYKGLKIEWYPDECAAPIPQIIEPVPSSTAPQRSSTSVPTRQAKMSGSNLYSLLDVDGSDSEEEDSDAEDTNTSQGLTGYPTNGVKINWADAAVVV